MFFELWKEIIENPQGELNGPDWGVNQPNNFMFR